MDGLSTLDEDNEDWGIEMVLAVLRASTKLDELELTLAPATQERLDAHLEANAMAAGRRFDFERALDNLALFGSASHLPSRLAWVLVKGGPEPEEVTWLERRRPPTLTDEETEELRNDARTLPLVKRFVSEVLPFSRTNYDPAVSSLLLRLAPGIEAAFWDALDTVARPGGPNENIEAIVAGACGGASPDFDRAIARFAQSMAEAGDWMEKEHAEETRQAEEHEVNAVAADQILEEPGDRYYNAQTGMTAVVKLRRVHDGIAWITDHPDRQLLISAAAELIGQSRRAPEPGELRLLISVAENWTRNAVWRAVKQHWQTDLADLLTAELAKCDLDGGMRGTLIEIAALKANEGSDPVPLLAEVAQRVAPERQLELVYDLMRTSLDGDGHGEPGLAARRARAERLSDGLPDELAELGRLLAALLAGAEIRSSAEELSKPARVSLSSLLTTVAPEVAGPLLCAGAVIGLDSTATARRLLATGDADDGVAAVQALLIDGRAAAKAVQRRR